jgi:hypothetical protein
MSANLDNLKAAYIADAASVTPTTDRLECLVKIDDWYAAATALADLQSKGMSSYSVGGRTVTRRDVPALERTVGQLQNEIKNVLYCRGSSYVDCRVDQGTT